MNSDIAKLRTFIRKELSVVAEAAPKKAPLKPRSPALPDVTKFDNAALRKLISAAQRELDTRQTPSKSMGAVTKFSDATSYKLTAEELIASWDDEVAKSLEASLIKKFESGGAASHSVAFSVNVIMSELGDASNEPSPSRKRKLSDEAIKTLLSMFKHYAVKGTRKR